MPPTLCESKLKIFTFVQFSYFLPVLLGALVLRLLHVQLHHLLPGPLHLLDLPEPPLSLLQLPRLPESPLLNGLPAGAGAVLLKVMMMIVMMIVMTLPSGHREKCGMSHRNCIPRVC